MVNGIKGWFEWLVTNQQCTLCYQMSTQLVCDACVADMPRFNLQYQAENLLSHPKILRELKVINFNHLYALAEYQWPYSHLLSRLKFNRSVIFAKALAELFCRLKIEPKSLPQALIPIPLHPARLAARKYNQAGLIGKYIARHFGLAFHPNALIRVVNTQPQTALGGAKRLKNTKNMFVLRQKLDIDHVAVFDDVITTGATLGAAVNSLRAQAPQLKVDAWSLCVTPEHR